MCTAENCVCCFVRQNTCTVFFLFYKLARLQSRDATFHVSGVTAISDTKNAFVGEGVECQHLALIISGDVIFIINSDRDDSIFVVYINSDIL